MPVRGRHAFRVGIWRTSGLDIIHITNADIDGGTYKREQSN